jgi:hypothetical protein
MTSWRFRFNSSSVWALTVRPREAGDIAHIETGVRALLNHRGVRLHFPRAPIRFARLRLRAVRLEAFFIVSGRTSVLAPEKRVEREPRRWQVPTPEVRYLATHRLCRTRRAGIPFREGEAAQRACNRRCVRHGRNVGIP